MIFGKHQENTLDQFNEVAKYAEKSALMAGENEYDPYKD